MTDVLVKKTNQSSLKIKENQKVNHEGDSRYFFPKPQCRLVVSPNV